MIKGTTKEISDGYMVNGVIINDQEWYVFIRVLEKAGVATVIDKKPNPGPGRQSKIYNVPPNCAIAISAK